MRTVAERDESGSTAKTVCGLLCGLACLVLAACGESGQDVDRFGEQIALQPSILFVLSDDISWLHAGAYGETAVQTPNFDRLASEGVLFTNAYASAPSCSPSRSAILTGQDFWRLGEAANLRGTLQRDQFQTYTGILARAGYVLGSNSKGWAPGNFRAGGWDEPPVGPPSSFKSFLAKQPADRPFCFWQGSFDAHRPYRSGSGRRSGKRVEEAPVPAFLPDHPTVRSDLLDYYHAVDRFDQMLGAVLAHLESAGRTENTLIIVTSDNGMPFPRGKANLYDYGVRVPMVVHWPERIVGPRVVHDFVNLTDLAPTFLHAAGIAAPAQMTGESLVPLLFSQREGWVEPERDGVVVGIELHAPARAGLAGYPSRALRTREYLYVRNFEPERRPAGDPEPTGFPGGPSFAFAEVAPGPTKNFMIRNRAEPRVAPLWKLAFGRRPAAELYDLTADPDQLNNVAADAAYSAVAEQMDARLDAHLKRTGDPRALGAGDAFEGYSVYDDTQRLVLREP